MLHGEVYIQHGAEINHRENQTKKQDSNESKLNHRLPFIISD
jgi:hypothetical protein